MDSCRDLLATIKAATTKGADGITILSSISKSLDDIIEEVDTEAKNVSF